MCGAVPQHLWYRCIGIFLGHFWPIWRLGENIYTPYKYPSERTVPNRQHMSYFGRIARLAAFRLGAFYAIQGVCCGVSVSSTGAVFKPIVGPKNHHGIQLFWQTRTDSTGFAEHFFLVVYLPTCVLRSCIGQNRLKAGRRSQICFIIP